MSNGKSPIDPNRLTVEQASKLLSAAAKIRIPEQQIADDLADGAPQNKDGTIIPRSEALASSKDQVRVVTPSHLQFPKIKKVLH